MIRKPHVSILMPVRDGEAFLARAIESVRAQTFSDFELLVVDDGSADRTPSLLEDFARHDGRIRVLRQDRKGLVAALNRGLAVAHADLIARLDADDEALPQRLERQVAYLQAHPEVVLLGTWADVVDGSGNRIGQLRPKTQPEALRSVLARTNPFVHSSVAFRAEPARKLGCYRAAFEAAEDDDLWLRLSETGEIANLPEVLVRYRARADSVTQVEAVRQLFSARMARRAAALRRQTGNDPSSRLTGPPDFLRPDSGTDFYADDARICRFLALADPERARTTPPHAVDLAAFGREISSLSHRERKVAQVAIMNLLARDSVSRVALSRLLFRLHPLRAVGLLWRKAFPPAMPREGGASSNS